MSKLLNTRRKNNVVLFSLNVFYIFILGLFDGLTDLGYIYLTFISFIYIASIFTIRDSGVKLFSAPIIIIILMWLGELLDLPVLSHLSGVLSTLFFFFVIVLLVKRVGNSKVVGPLEFLESINVYLLFGIAGSLLFSAVYSFIPDAFNSSGITLKYHSDFIYFSFVTMTTVGYGDITPAKPLARSLAIFFSVSGQLYLTMIIAMLVGKYIGQAPEKEQQ